MRVFLILFLASLFFVGTAEAHVGTEAVGGLLSGISHPLMGLDHLVAMFAVGVWGALLKEKAVWVLPIVFPLIMALGGVLGILGLDIPAIEIGIALSSIVIGAFIAIGKKTPLPIAAVVVGLFAIFHGYAHGTELPSAANPLTYSIGFVMATGFLHLLGIAFGFLLNVPKGILLVRMSGLFIALLGTYFFANI